MSLTFDYYGQQAYDTMQKSRDSLFLTGKAGTGKSTLITHFLETTHKNFLLLAPTGVAAINVGGSTIHSFFLFHPGIVIDEIHEDEHLLKGDRRNVLQKADIVIIDEISMVRADMLDCIDKSMKMNLDNDLPFGGKQVIFVGDLYQLPPIVRNEERAYFTEHYTSPFFFSSYAYQQLDPPTIELQKIYRQRDPAFKNILNKIRIGIPSSQDLEHLNQRVGIQPNSTTHAITLVTTNADADRINQQHLEALDTPIYTTKARIAGDVPRSYYANSEIVHFKPGSQIMMLKNSGTRQNGSIGQLIAYDEDEDQALVEIDGYEYEVGFETRRVRKPSYDKKKGRIENEIVGTFTQMPFKLAWAITIHKSQGLTFDQLKVDLGKRVFAGGQTYVALSRGTSLNGLYLERPVKKTDIRLDKRIRYFMGTALLQQKQQLIQQAIDTQQDITFQYIKFSGDISERTIAPHTLEDMVYQDRQFPGVGGICRLRNAERVFHLGRMFELEIVDRK